MEVIGKSGAIPVELYVVYKCYKKVYFRGISFKKQHFINIILQT